MTIKVYPSIMPGEPDEVYHDHGVTIEEWVKLRADSYQRSSVQPISCSVNGAIVAPLDWADVVMRESDTVEFRVVPRGGSVGDFFSVALPFWGGSIAAADAAIQSFMPDIPGQQGMGNQGERLAPANAKANTARLGQAVPELFGEYIRYPDYLNQPHRYYANTKTQVLRLMLSVGVGSYEVSPSSVKIGETPISELDNVDYTIYAPGADVSGTLNHENWYAAPEVGSTTASPGIRLKGVTYDERTYIGSGSASGDNIIGIIVGELWTPGLQGSIKLTQDVTVGNASPADFINGSFPHLAAGMTVNIESSSTIGLNGTYVVRTINAGKTQITLETTGGAAIDSLSDTAGLMAIDKADTLYWLTDTFGGFQITVERRLAGGAVDPDWDGQLPTASMDLEIEWNAGTFTANRAGPFVACPEGESCDRIEVDIFAPQGLGTIDGESILSLSRTIRIEYRAVGGSGWISQTHTVSGNTRDQLGWTFTVTPSGPIYPEVRVSRIGEEDVSIEALDRLEFTGLRTRLPTVTSYPGVTTMAVTITGSDEISTGSNNQINLVATRKLEPVSGGAETATRSISRAAAYVAKSLGYDVDQLDIVEFERLDSLWATRGDTFDYVFSDGTAKDAIDTILRAGFAEMTLDGGMITPVRDEPRAQFEQGYSPENMTAPLQRTFTGSQPDEPDGVEVEYTKAGTWTTETVMCTLPGDQMTKVDKIKLDGVTDETRAWRIGMRRRRMQRYRRWVYSFSTELDALNSSYLSYVPLLDDIPGYGKVAILTSISEGRITVSEPLEWQEGQSHVIAYRDENGDTVGPFTATQGPDEYTVLVSIPQPWPAVMPSDREQTHVYFGTTERWSFPALITEVNPGGPLSVSVTATNYDERVYLSDDAQP